MKLSMRVDDHRHWFSRLAGRLYWLGVISSSCYSVHGSQDPVVTLYFDWHPRPYVLGWQRRNWVCVLRRRHWPSPIWHDSDCGRCIPWPCCGSIRDPHLVGCDEA